MIVNNKYSLLFNEISFVFECLLDKNYALIKGDTLSFLAYNSFGKRKYRDFDILVSKRELNKIERIIQFNGFERKSINNDGSKIMPKLYSHQAMPLVKELTPGLFATLDLNFDIFWGEYEGKRVDIDEFLMDAVEMEIYGVKVKTLPPLKAMVQLVLHHYKDMNSIFLLATRNSIKYEMFKDVYYLLKSNLDEISIEKLYAISF